MPTIAELRALLSKATPGKWDADPGERETVFAGYNRRVRCDTAEDAALVVAVHAALPALLDVAETAAAAREAHNRGWDGDRDKAMTALGIALHKLEEP